MNTSESIKLIAGALCQFQHDVGVIAKTADNPFFKSKYASLPDLLTAIKEPMHKNGLSFVQFPSGTNGLETLLMHTSGEWIRDSYTMTPSKNDPQGIGSCITYMRRYALGSVLGLATDEDDDGNAASNVQTPKSSPKAQREASTAWSKEQVEEILAQGNWELKTGSSAKGNWYALDSAGQRGWIKEATYNYILDQFGQKSN